jgi:hypothetical protein
LINYKDDEHSNLDLEDIANVVRLNHASYQYKKEGVEGDNEEEVKERNLIN